MDNSYFPMFVDISHWKILVAGGGVIATRRVKTLLKFQAQITVVAPKVTEELQLLAKEKQIKLLKNSMKNRIWIRRILCWPQRIKKWSISRS